MSCSARLRGADNIDVTEFINNSDNLNHTAPYIEAKSSMKIDQGANILK